MLHLKFLTQNYNLFKISALGLFFKYSLNFANTSLDILIKFILIEKQRVSCDVEVASPIGLVVS